MEQIVGWNIELKSLDSIWIWIGVITAFILIIFLVWIIQKKYNDNLRAEKIKVKELADEYERKRPKLILTKELDRRERLKEIEISKAAKAKQELERLRENVIPKSSRTHPELDLIKKARLRESVIAKFGRTNKELDRREKENEISARTNQPQIKKAPETIPQTIFKNNWKDYEKILSENNIKSLYHFTDQANISSIKIHGGLFSWHFCFFNKIEIPIPGGDDLSRKLDKNKGCANYVRVSFTKNHPMMHIAKKQGRIFSPVILEVDPQIIFWKNSKYANKNATRNDVRIGSTLDDFKEIRFDIVKQDTHFGLSDNDKPYYQAEILILEKIPIQFIKNISSI
jgi:hypothetical protein